MHEIDPKEVLAMIRTGELRFGMELEFTDLDVWGAAPTTAKFAGMIDDQYPFVCKGEIIMKFKRARFPMPELKDGDPIVVFKPGGHDYKRHFAKFHSDGRLGAWDVGKTRWTSGVVITWDNWRLPTRDELKNAGYPEDYYAKSSD